MSAVARRRAILTDYLNNLYGCYVSLQSFIGFLMTKKQQKRNNILMAVISSRSSEYLKRETKRNSPRHWVRPGQASTR